MDNTAKELAKYIRKGNNANDDVILRAPVQVSNPLYIKNIPPYTKNVEPENALIFKNENNESDIVFRVKYADLTDMATSNYKLLFSFDGVNWCDIPVDTNGISFTLKKGDKVMFRANINSSFLDFEKITFNNLTSGITGFVTVTGNISALVSKDGSIQSSTNSPIEPPSVFKNFRFRNFEINSTKSSKLDSMLLGLFENCLFQTMSFDCDNYLFLTFYNKHNSFSHTNYVAIFIKTHESFLKLFENLTNVFTSILYIVKIYDTEEPNMLYYDNNGSDDVCGILDRNIGAKSIFDCGYFFELSKNPIKPWTIDEIYNTSCFPYDGNNYLTEHKDYLDTIKHFCGPHYTFYNESIAHELILYTDFLNIGDNSLFGYPIIILRSMPPETINHTSILTGFLLTTFIVSDDSADLITKPCALFLAPDASAEVSQYYSYINHAYDRIKNMFFRTLRPCVVSQEVTNVGTSAEIYEQTEKILNEYRP